MNEYRDSSNRLSLEWPKIQSAQYSEIVQRLVQEFDLVPKGKLIVGFEEAFQDFTKDELVIGLEWDIWSGFIVVAKTSDAEDLARQIAARVGVEAT